MENSAIMNDKSKIYNWNFPQHATDVSAHPNLA